MVLFILKMLFVLQNPHNCYRILHVANPQLTDRQKLRGHMQVGGFAQTVTIYNFYNKFYPAQGVSLRVNILLNYEADGWCR